MESSRGHRESRREEERDRGKRRDREQHRERDGSLERERVRDEEGRRHKPRDEKEQNHQRGYNDRHYSKRGSKSRSRSPSRNHHHRRHHEELEASSSDSGSGSETEEARRARRRKEKRREERDEEDDYERRRRRRKRETSEERLQRRRKKREKKQARKGYKSGAILDYGKHGIISEADVTSRFTSEFRQWLVEERHINPETISRSAEKKEMASFIEDYNTATMPSEKYYNLEAHERRMAMIRAGETVEDVGGYDPLADEAAAKASFRAQQRAAESSRGTPKQWQSKEQLEALRRVQMERIEAAKLKQLGIETSANMGVRMDGTEFDRR